MSFKDKIKSLSKDEKIHLLHYQIGLEKESLRISSAGDLSLHPHFQALGSPLTHPYITTDFSESQLEMVTPVFDDIASCLTYLKNLHRYIYTHIDKELLWPFSMPCRLPEHKKIPIASYGSSDSGQEKEIYRRGLTYRYGIDMQLICGLHVNFSFSSHLLKIFHKKSKSSLDFNHFKNELYFNTIQNFLYEGWLISYLFGASTVCDSSYKSSIDLEKFISHATSLRMSVAGYFNKTSCQSPISFSNLDSYIQDLSCATHKLCPKFSQMGLVKDGQRIQLNDAVFQIENEHYARMRPKPPSTTFLRPLDALQYYGVNYLEMRSLDLNPFSPIGIEASTLYFLHVFFLYCLLEPSPVKETKTHAPLFLFNQNQVALKGLSKKLMLKDIFGKISLKDWSLKIFDKLLAIADTLDTLQGEITYKKIVFDEKQKLENIDATFAKICNHKLKNQSFLQLGLDLSKKHRDELLKEPLSTKQKKLFDRLSLKSLQDQQALEENEVYSLKNYEDLEASTQILIRECQNQGLKVTVIDRAENLIQIEKKRKKEFIKQATITKKDSYLTYHLLKNKYTTKVFLEKHHLKYPQSFYVSSQEDVLKACDQLSSPSIVVKPSKQNFGHGIFFIEKKDKKAILKATEESFSFDSHLLIEEFIHGKEYRFLVIKDQVVAILHRDPAHVIGDGVSTIDELIKKKNQHPRVALALKNMIELGELELDMLKKQKLTPKSILKDRQKIYLRINSNISTGGDGFDVTNTMPTFFQKVAIKASQAIKASICGVDMIISDLNKQNYSILELNFNPNIAIHYYPSQGRSRNAAPHILSLLNFD